MERLYEKVTGELLSDSIAQGLVTVSRVDKAIEEEYLGKYRIPELILNSSGETVRFSPKGRNVVGAKGRVELVGDVSVHPRDHRHYRDEGGGRQDDTQQGQETSEHTSAKRLGGANHSFPERCMRRH